MVTTSKELLLTSITHFYDKNPSYRELLKRLVEGDHPISLRLIDGFITHYAKQKNVIYWLDANGTIQTTPMASYKRVQVYQEYRSQLKAYTKMYFDPFRRHERISFVIQNKPLQTLETTIGQLNFFRWIFQTRILDYIEKNHDVIERMLQTAVKPKTVPHNTITETMSFLKFD